MLFFFFFFQAEDGIRDYKVTGVQTCALPICSKSLCTMLFCVCCCCCCCWFGWPCGVTGRIGGEPPLANRMLMLLATVVAFANFNPMRKVESPASDGTSNCLITASTAAMFSSELEVRISELECGSLVMRTLPYKRPTSRSTEDVSR